MDIKRLLTLAIIGIFLLTFFIGNVNAVLETKSFDPNAKNYGEIQIDDWLGISNKADYRLIDYGASVIDVWAEGEYKLYQKTHLFTGVFYKDMIGQQGSLTDVKFYIWVEEEYQEEIIDEWDEECGVEYYGQTICVPVKSTSHFETKTKGYWKEYVKGDDLPESEGKWRMEAKRKANKPIDFVLEAHGKTFDEWAWFNDSWDYKIEVTIDNPDSATHYNETKKILFTHDGYAQSDCEDIRVVDSTETTEIPIQTNNTYANVTLVCNSTSAEVVFDIDEIAGSGSNTYYIYFGNDAVGLGSYDETPLYYYKDFSQDTSMDEWLAITGSWAVSGGYLQETDTTYFDGKNLVVLQIPLRVDGTMIANISSVGGADNLYQGIETQEDATSSGDLYVNDYVLLETSYSGGYVQAYNDVSSSNHDYGNLVTGFDNDLTLKIEIDGNYNNFSVDTDQDGSWDGNVYEGGGYAVPEGRFGVISQNNHKTKAGWIEIASKKIYDNPTTYSLGSIELSNQLTVNANSPIDYYNTTSLTVEFDCNATDETGVYTLNLTIDNTVYETQSGAGNTNLSLLSNETLSEGLHEWWCVANDDAEAKNSSIRYLTIDTTSPTVNEANNLTNLTTFSFPVSSNWNYTVLDDHIDSCYYATSDNSTNVTVTCNSSIQTNWSSGGEKEIIYCANDTFGFETCRSDNITVVLISYSQSESVDPIGEGGEVAYDLQVNFTGATMPTTVAYFIFNGTSYSPTTTASSDHYDFNYNLTMLDGWGNTTGNLIDWHWEYNITGFVDNSSTTTENTTVYSVSIDDCSSYSDVILNLSLKDEEGNSYINVSADATNIEVDLILSKGSEEWQYSNQWTDENNVSICVPSGLLNNTNYTIDFTIGFDADDHVNEFYYLDQGLLQDGGTTEFNSLTNRSIDLMDLLTADSTSFLFNYFDDDGLVVDDIIVHVFRNYIGEGIYREVERSKQNDDGDTVVHLVEEDVIYYFVISQNGTILFTSSTYTALCQTTPCEIQLEESGGFQDFDTTDWDLIDNGAYTINALSSTREVNLTYALDSASTMNVTVYALDEDGTYSSVGSDQATGTSGSLIVTVPTISGNTTFFASVYQDGEFKKSQWVDFEQDAGLYFGNTLSLFLGALIILALGLMAVAEGSGTIIFLMLGMFIAMVLGLVDYRTSTGLNILIYFIVAGGIIIWKLTRRNR